jgi:Calcineurin-like phosphoesterase/Bacterial Ig domain
MLSNAELFSLRSSFRKFVVLAIILLYSLSLLASSPGDFTVVMLPDPQNYSQYYPQIFDSQTQWIAANAVAQNIQVVLGVGDIVNNAQASTEWQNANHSISILDQASVPYAIAIGNHDYDSLPPTARQATYFNQYFGPSRYSGKPYYGGSNFPPGSNENFYQTFTWGGKPYLILVLEFVPRSSAVAWAKSVLSANTDKEVIVVTHSYLYSDSTTVDQCDTADMVGDENGAMLWSDLISQYSNISVVVSGHITNKFTARRSDVGINDNFVHQIFANWQDWTNGGNGYLRIMQFSPSTNTIQVKTYSPYTQSYLTDSANQFTLKWHNDGVPGSGTASVTGRIRSSVYGLSCIAVSGATVAVGAASAVTDSNGYYSLTVPRGQVFATAKASGFLDGSQTVVLNDYFTNQLDFYLTPTPPCPQNSVDPSVTICSPANGAAVSSPLNVIAGTHSSAPVVSLAIWLDGKRVFNTGQGLLNTPITVAPGPHQLAVQGANGARQVFTQTLSITSVGTGCQPLSTVPSENICAPTSGASGSSPIAVQSAAHMANPVKYSQIWLDGAFRYQVASPFINTSITAATGTHRLTVQTMDTSGVLAKQTIYVTVANSQPGGCTQNTADPSVTICVPANNATLTSPVTITASARDSAATVVNMFVWVDGVKQWIGSGSSVNTALPMVSGTRRVTVQAKNSIGRYFQSTVNVTVK